MASGLDIQLQKKLYSPIGERLLDLAFAIQAGERIAIVGPSGSGKTTFLRMLAGTMHPDKGRIVFDNNCWFDAAKNIKLPPQKRSVGLMFQSYALFPNMTVFQNLKYALQPKQSQHIISELIQVMELNELVHRYPSTLSGGEQQRVALARALVPQPRLLLLDEPLSALDTSMREKLQDYILKVQEKYQLTIIWVTHHLQEVTKIAHRVFLLENNRLQEQPLQNKPIEISGVIQSIEQQEDQQVVTIGLKPTAYNLLEIGKHVVVRPED